MPGGEVQAVRFGRRAWGVQHHPEIDRAVLVSWAAGDRDDHLEKGIDSEAVLDEVEAAQSELDRVLAPAGRAPGGAGPTMTRASTGKGELLRLGFQDTERSLAGLAELGEVDRAAAGDPRPDRRPRPGAARAGAARRRHRRPGGAAAGARRRRGHRDAAAVGARREHRAGRPPRAPPRPLARADRPDARLDAGPGVRAARGAARGGGRRPRRRPAGRRDCPTARRWTRCGWSTAGCCSVSPPATSPTTTPSTTSRPSCPTSPPARSRRRWRWRGPGSARPPSAPGWPWSRWASAAATSSTTSPTSTWSSSSSRSTGSTRRSPPRAATQLAGHLMQVCSDHTGEGTIWPVDAALRPEGKAGPLVRTLASHRGYYERWAKTWEFQALLKARPVAGDLELGARVPRDGRPDGLAGRRARGLRDRRAGDAAPGARAPARPRGRAAAQARLGRAARRRVRRPAAAAGARPRRRAAARRRPR